jgi:hypothetical protein
MLAVQGRACGPCSAVAQTAWAEMGDAEPFQSPTEREWSARDFENWRGVSDGRGRALGFAEAKRRGGEGAARAVGARALSRGTRGFA